MTTFTTEAFESRAQMPVGPALQIIARLRTDNHIIVSNQGSARLWPRLSDHELDFNYVPSTMGGAIPFGLGLALAAPEREVLVLSGDGSLLMSLGSLVTVVDSGAANVSIVLLDNGIYEVTGGQKTAAARADTDFAGFARAAGFPNVSHFWSLDDWHRRAAGVFASRGPRFIWLQAARIETDCLHDPPTSIAKQIDRLRAALTKSPTSQHPG